MGVQSQSARRRGLEKSEGGEVVAVASPPFEEATRFSDAINENLMVEKSPFLEIPLEEVLEEGEVEMGEVRSSSLSYSTEGTVAQSALRAYVNAAQKFTLLTPDEEKALAFRIQAGDLMAKKEMVERNLRLVIKAARRYSASNLEILDLIEEGNLGLIRAAEKFDPSRGCRLSTYAMLWIKQSMERAIMLNSTSMVKLPIHVTKAIYRHRKEVRQLTKTLGRLPTRQETLESLKIDGEKLDRMDILNEYPKAIWNSDEDEEGVGTALGRQRDSFKNGPLFDNQVRILQEKVRQAFRALTLRQKEVLVRRFGLLGHAPQTLDEVGRSVGLTRERVRQIQSQALALLKDELESLGVSLKDLDLECLNG